MRNQVGEWRPGVGVNVTDTAAFFEPGIGNVTLIVITILVSRYISTLSNSRRACYDKRSVWKWRDRRYVSYVSSWRTIQAFYRGIVNDTFADTIETARWNIFMIKKADVKRNACMQQSSRIRNIDCFTVSKLRHRRRTSHFESIFENAQRRLRVSRYGRRRRVSTEIRVRPQRSQSVFRYSCMNLRRARRRRRT